MYKDIFFISFLLLASFFFSVSPVKALEVNDMIVPGYVCRSEEMVLKVAEIDVASAEEAEQIMNKLFQVRECVAIGDFPVKVVEVILEYKDSEGRLTEVLAVTGPNPEIKFFVFNLVEGKGS